MIRVDPRSRDPLRASERRAVTKPPAGRVPKATRLPPIERRDLCESAWRRGRSATMPDRTPASTRAETPVPARTTPPPGTRLASPSPGDLDDLVRALAGIAPMETQSDAFRQLVATRLRAAWPDADAQQIASAAIRIRLMLVGQPGDTATAPPPSR